MEKIKHVWLMLFLLVSSAALAQDITVKGQIWDGTMNEGLPGAKVALLKADSTQVDGVVSDSVGNFTLKDQKAGKYILKVSYVGYLPFTQNIILAKTNPTHDVGTITLTDNAKLMKEAQVTAKLAQVEMKADTFVYNADAYRLPEGSALEELVRKLPGAEVSDDGTIKINGKTVSKIMVGGKEYFSSDTKMAMKNLPTKMVEKIKAYDKKSDYSRITGIDDGEEETVLDLTVKKGMKEGWLINVDLGGGTEDRYTLKGNINRFTDHQMLSIIGSRNNVGDRGFPGGGPRGFSGGGGGITTSNMAGATFAWDNAKQQYTKGYFEVGGNVRWSHSKTENDTHSNSETMLNSTTSTFANTMSNALNHSSSVGADLRMEWQIDSLTNLFFRPSFSHSESDAFTESQNVTFNQNPYNYMTDPLAQYKSFEDKDSIRVNDNDRISSSDSKSNSGNADLQINRSLGKSGRNITLNVGGAYGKSESNSLSRSIVHYYNQTTAKKATATYQDNTQPAKNYNYQAKLSYSEPIFTGANIQFSYQAQHRFQDSRRTMMVYEDLADSLSKYGLSELSAYNLYTGNYNGVDLQNYGIDLTQLTKDMENSQYATYKEFNQDATVMFRYSKKYGGDEDGNNKQEIRVNAGVSFQPQRTLMDYAKSSVDTTITRHTFNWSPRIDIRWKISNTSSLRVRYRGSMSQPSMTNLIEVMDSSDPLNISTGNAGLESSWSDRFFAFYNGYNTDKQRGWNFNFNGTINRRTISNSTIYDETTGGRYSRPLNIDGNWNVGSWIGFNTAMGQKKMWNVSTNTSLNYSNQVGYISSNLDETARSFLTSGTNGGVDMDGLFKYMNGNNLIGKSTTKQLNIGETLRLNVRGDMMTDGSFDVGLTGGGNYVHSRNDQQTNNNLDTWTFNYGGNFTLSFPWNMTLASDISEQCRRGYDDESMNTNELVWNAQISQNFKKWLKGHELTLSVEAYDILKQRSNISRAISATMRSDTYTNAINSYLMVHLIYRLNLLGNKDARRNGFGGPGGPGGFGGGGRDSKGGNGGGGRPMGGGGFGGGRF